MKGSLPLLFLFIVTFAAGQQSPADMFQHGNALYQAGDYEKALAAYRSLLAAGYVSGELYFNLGNTCYKLGHIAQAVLQYERARRFMPNDEDLNHNLRLVNLTLADRIEPTPRLFLWDAWDSVKEAFSLNAITWLVYLFFVLVVAAVAGMILARTYSVRKVALLGGTAAALLLVASGAVFAAKLSDFNARDQGVVVANVVNIKNSPDPKSSDAFVLHTGVKIRITDRLNEWIKIRLADGKVGWMMEDDVEII